MDIKHHEESHIGLVSPERPFPTGRQPGKCTLARKRLKKVFHMRKYYLSVIGLTGFEIFLVLIRIILETESLRVPPGHHQNSILRAQLALECISLFLLTLFVVEIPFKMWALGIHTWGRSLLYVIDGLVCAVCFSLNIYNICRHGTIPMETLASKKQIELCGLTHITYPANTASTFAEIFGLIIAYRLWYIKGYITKTVTLRTVEYNAKINGLQKIIDESELRISHLQKMLQDQTMQRTSRNMTRPSGNTVRSSNMTGLPRSSRD